MRFSRGCDSMNLTGCDAWHTKLADGSISSHLINHEIEYGFLFGGLFIVSFILFYIYIWNKRYVKKEAGK